MWNGPLLGVLQGAPGRSRGRPCPASLTVSDTAGFVRRRNWVSRFVWSRRTTYKCLPEPPGNSSRADLEHVSAACPADGQVSGTGASLLQGDLGVEAGPDVGE